MNESDEKFVVKLNITLDKMYIFVFGAIYTSVSTYIIHSFLLSIKHFV